MDETMNDQQVTSHQLAWLAGIFDGEGTFSIIKMKRPGGKHYLTGRITLSNTSVSMISEITKILSCYNINGHLWLEERRKKNHKRCYHITVNKIDNVLMITRLMLPYLVNKKPRAELLIRFLESRKNYSKKAIRDPKTGRISGIKEVGYSEEEYDLFEKIKTLNTVGYKKGTSQTIR